MAAPITINSTTLINSGTCSYGGVTFTCYKSSVSSRPIRDSAGRTVKYVEITITVERGLLTAANNATITDATLDSLKPLLETDGNALKFTGKGFGDLQVNVQGQPTKDVAFGPKTEVLDWTPVGNGQACFLSWKCTTRIPVCPTTTKFSGIAQFCWDYEVSWDDEGYSTITVNGEIEIAMTWAVGGGKSARAVVDTVDNYKEQCIFQPPIGWQRKRCDWKVSEDKRTAHWSIVDEQLAAPLPDGCSRARVEQTLKSGTGFAIWEGSLSAELNVPAGGTLLNTLVQFLAILQQRLSFVVNPQRLGGALGAVGNALLNAVAGRRPTVLLTNYMISRDLAAGRSARYSVNYKIFRSSLLTIMADSGFLEPLPNASFESWRMSLKDTVNSARGQAGIRFPASTDLIIDLCAGGQRPHPPAPGNAGPVPPSGYGTWRPGGGGGHGGSGGGGGSWGGGGGNTGGGGGGGGDGGGGGAWGDAAPPPQASWLGYLITYEYQEQKGTAVHKRLGGTVTDQGSLYDPTQDVAPAARRMGGVQSLQQTSDKDVIQRVSAPPAKLYLHGKAERIGYEIPLPRLRTLGNQIVGPGRVVTARQGQVGLYGSVPIFRSEYTLEFDLPAPLAQPLPRLADIMSGTNGSGAGGAIPGSIPFLG